MVYGIRMNILISIKPKYVKKIVAGEKKFEYRKRLFKKEVEKIYIYSSSPEKKIIACFSYSGYNVGMPNEIWEKTKHASGITEREFKAYFWNRLTAYALKIKNLIVFENPVDPYSANRNFRPPQSFMYIKHGYEI